MNKRKIMVGLGGLLLTLSCATLGNKAEAASAPEIPVVADDIQGKNPIDATGRKRQKSPKIKKKYQKMIFIDDSSSLTLSGDLGNYDVTFKSSDTSVLKVKEVSKETCDYYGVSAGTANIIIRVKSTSGLFFMNKTTTIKAKVTVSPRAASVKFRRSKYRIGVGKSKQIRTTIRPSISKEKPVYESLNPRIVTINQKGVIRAKNEGSTYVTATLQNGIQAKCRIIVKHYKTKANS